MSTNVHGIKIHHFDSGMERNISITVRGTHGSDEDYDKFGVQSSFCIIMPIPAAQELLEQLTQSIKDAQMSPPTEIQA